MPWKRLAEKPTCTKSSRAATRMGSGRKRSRAPWTLRIITTIEAAELLRDLSSFAVSADELEREAQRFLYNNTGFWWSIWRRKQAHFFTTRNLHGKFGVVSYPAFADQR